MGGREITSRRFPHKYDGMDRKGKERTKGRETERQRDPASNREPGEADKLGGHIPKLSPVL